MADTFAEIAEKCRKALSVSVSYVPELTDAVTRSARTLLRNYNFPKSVISYTQPIDNGAQSFALDIDTGKIKAVRIKTFEGGIWLYKRLRRRSEDVLPVEGGIGYYSIVGEELFLDSPLNEDDYHLEIWYQGVLPDAHEGWLCSEFEDVLFHAGCMNGAPLIGKPELAGIWQPLVQRDEVGLAIFLNELEWNDHDLRMGDGATGGYRERYEHGYST